MIGCSQSKVLPIKNDFANIISVIDVWNDFQSNSLAAHEKYGGLKARDYKYNLISVDNIDFVENDKTVKKLLNDDGTDMITFHFDTRTLPLNDYLMNIQKGDDLELICMVFDYKYQTPYIKVTSNVISKGRVAVYSHNTYKTAFSRTELSFAKCYPTYLVE